MKERLAFIGAGSIAEAWLEGFLAKGVAPEDMTACDPRPDRLQEIARRWGLPTSERNVEGVKSADLVILATPPPLTLPVLQEILPALTSRHLVISLAAGVPVARLQHAAPGIAILRVMPNLPSLVGEGMNLVVFGSAVPNAGRQRVEAMLELLGRWWEVDDAQMDCWCALCAVGPTFLFPVIHSLHAAAVAQGLPPELAMEAVSQVIAGTAHLALRGHRTVPQLESMIGLHTLQEEEAGRLFTSAYEQAVQRLQGLGKKLAA